MRFYLLLGLINVACFLPLYSLNVRASPNPFRFLAVSDKTIRTWPLKLMYLRYESTDPFRIHFDFTVVVLIAVGMGLTSPTVQWVAVLLLAFGFVEILYTTVMQSIFKRAPALLSDLSLLRAGLGLAQRQAYWMIPAAVGVLFLIVWLARAATSSLFAIAPEDRWPPVVAAVLLLPPCFYHATRYYGVYLWRTVYSPLLHLGLNLRFSVLLKRLYDRDATYFERRNLYKRVRLEGAPNVVIVCIESYGSIVYRDRQAGAGLAELLGSREEELEALGYRFASTFSEAPLFAGGSWLSYASFLYGTLIDNLQLYDGLFSHASGFTAYESLLHVLRRNGHRNILLCPLGGVDRRTVDWESLDRCFHAQHRIDIDALGYVGPRVNYLGVVRRFSPLDQFSLNYGYEVGCSGREPFSLFFCTLNSHYPWHSTSDATDSWRDLNTPRTEAAKEPNGSMLDRYNAAMRYQLDYVLRFARDRAGDSPLVVVFGDHQPPFITPDHLGKSTPVHVISRNETLVEDFLSHGFVESVDLTDLAPRPIRHEGFMSLLMRGLQSAYGTESGLELPYRERGSAVFDDAWAELTAER